jgi:hypothetical protein
LWRIGEEMDNTELCKEAHAMMVKRKWKILTNDGLKVPALEDVERSARWITHRMRLRGTGVVDSGCFRARWNKDTEEVELEILKREYMDE